MIHFCSVRLWQWSLINETALIEERGSLSHQLAVPIAGRGLCEWKAHRDLLPHFLRESCGVHTLITCLSGQVRLFLGELLCNHYDVMKGLIWRENGSVKYPGCNCGQSIRVKEFIWAKIDIIVKKPAVFFLVLWLIAHEHTEE